MRKRHSRGWLLRLIRTASGLKQQQIAFKTFFDQSSVSRIESGKVQVSDEVVAEYVEACGGIEVVYGILNQLQDLLESFGGSPLKPA